MKNKLLLLALGINSTSLFAGTMGPVPELIQPMHGLMVGAEFGWAEIETPESRARRVQAGFGEDLLAHSRGNTAWELNLAYLYPVNSQWYFGGEVGYTDYGHSEITYSLGNQYEFTLESLNLLAVGQYNIDNRNSVFVKAGGALTRETYQNKVIVSAGPDFYSDKTKFLPMLKAGVAHQATKRIQVNLTYTYVFGDDQDFVSQAFGGRLNPNLRPDVLTNVASAQMIAVGLKYSLNPEFA